ncbi:MAG: hypothetical protein KAI89_06990 [Emcibacter sp.]|nr:hypothetical protein [Emcibacter sp.]
MLKEILLSFTFILYLIFIPHSANADSSKEDKLSKALVKYEKTGKIENCLRLRNVKTSRVIDDYNILFYMKGKKAYLNTLKRRCSRLSIDGSFSYKVSNFQLCDYDHISVFDAHGQTAGGFCGLSKFVEYEIKPKVENQ